MERAPRNVRLRENIALRELVRTNDAVLVSAVEALLDAAQIPHLRARPEHERARRLARHSAAPVLVAESTHAAARRLLEEAGLGHELRPDAIEHGG